MIVQSTNQSVWDAIDFLLKGQFKCLRAQMTRRACAPRVGCGLRCTIGPRVVATFGKTFEERKHTVAGKIRIDARLFGIF